MLKACARRANSFLPLALTRTDRSPRVIWAMTAFIPLMGLNIRWVTDMLSTNTSTASSPTYISVRSWMLRRLSYMSCAMVASTTAPSTRSPSTTGQAYRPVRPFAPSRSAA